MHGDANKIRKGLAKKLESMVIVAKDVLYTQEFEDDRVNFDVVRRFPKLGYMVRIDITPLRKKQDGNVADVRDN
jgi:hypothetical protein